MNRLAAKALIPRRDWIVPSKEATDVIKGRKFIAAIHKENKKIVSSLLIFPNLLETRKDFLGEAGVYRMKL